MKSIILSSYFTTNTKIVANFCRHCYSMEEEVLITSVNLKFLKEYDHKYYQMIAKKILFKPATKTTEKNNSRKFNEELKRLMKLKQGIRKKYLKILKTKKTFKVKQEFDEKKQENIEFKNDKDIELEQKRETIQFYDSRVGNKVDKNKITPKWIPPISPHNLLEEKYYNDPWALLVVTIFLNKTSSVLALPYMERFFEDFKGPYDVLKVETSHLEPYFNKIGLTKTRATQIWRMSSDFVTKDWKKVSDLYGVGKYGEDAYRMFHLGDFSVQPTDRYLRIYKAWYEMTKNHEKLGVFNANSQVYLEDYYVKPEDEDRTEDAV